MRLFRVALILILLIGSFHLCCTANDSVPLEQLDFANGLFQRGMYNMAVSEYKEFIEQYPESTYLSEAYFGVAESLFFMEKYDEAVDAYEDFILQFKEPEKASIANLRITQCLFFKEEYKAALARTKKIKGKVLDKNYKQILFFYRAKIFLALKKQQPAVKLFEKAVKLLPESVYAVLSMIELGDISFSGGEYGKAVKYFNEAYEKADNENRFIALYKKAEAEFALKEYGDASGDFREILESGEVSGDISVNSLTNLLFCLFNLKKHEEVISEYSERGKLFNDVNTFFDAHYTVISSYSALEKNTEALSLIDRLLGEKKLNSEYKSKLMLEKAKLLFNSKDYDKTLRFINDSMDQKDFPRDQILYIRGESYYALGRYKESFDCFDAILKEFREDSKFFDKALLSVAYSEKMLSNNTGSIRSFLLYYDKGADELKKQDALYNAILLETKTGLIDDAISHCEIFVNKYDNEPMRENMLYRLGSLYSEKKMYEKAAAVFEDFITEYKNSEILNEAYFQAAYNFQLATSYSNALQYYEKISDGRSNKLRYSALKNMGIIHLKRKDDESAARLYDSLIAEFTNNDIDIDIYLWLTRYKIKNRDFLGANRVIELLERKSPDGEKSKEINYFKGESLRGLKKYEEAISAYEGSIKGKGEPVFEGASNIGIGLSFVALKDYDSAEKAFDAAVMVNPDDNTINMRSNFEMANMRKLQDRLEDAYRLYMRVAILYSDNFYSPSALLNAGEIFEKLNKPEQAEQTYTELLNKYGKTSFAEKAKERLSKLNGS